MRSWRLQAATIAASDRDAGAITAARANAERAGVRGPTSSLLFGRCRQRNFQMWTEAGSSRIRRTVCASAKRIACAIFGRSWEMCSGNARAAGGWRFCRLIWRSSDNCAFRFASVASLSNGGIPVRIMVGDVP